LAQPALRTYRPLIFATVGIYFLFSFGLLQPSLAASFGFMANAQAAIFAGLWLIAALGVGFLPKLRQQFYDLPGLAVLGAVIGFGFLLAALPLKTFGILPLLLIIVGGELAIPWLSVAVNQYVDSQHRATTLSTIALLTKVPYVITGIATGLAVEHNLLPLVSFVIGAGVLSLVGWTAWNVGFDESGNAETAAKSTEALAETVT
jgi:hypothetical protein